MMKHHSANKTLHPSPAAGNIRQYLIKGDMHTTFFFFFWLNHNVGSVIAREKKSGLGEELLLLLLPAFFRRSVVLGPTAPAAGAATNIFF